MFGLIAVGSLAVLLLLLWAILRLRQIREGPDDEDYGGKYDDAPLNPVPLREYTPTGELDLQNPPPGYRSSDIPRD